MSYGDTALEFQAGGGIVSALGAFMAIQAQQSQLRSAAEIADINAGTAERSAQAALRSGQRAEQRSMLATAQLKSRQRVGLAANGVDLGQGSAANVLTSTDVMGEIDHNTIAANAVADAWGYRAQATNFGNEALTKRAQAGAMSPGMAAATSLLGSASQVASSWYSLNKAGELDRYSSRPAPRNYGRGDQ